MNYSRLTFVGETSVVPHLPFLHIWNASRQFHGKYWFTFKQSQMFHNFNFERSVEWSLCLSNNSKRDHKAVCERRWSNAEDFNDSIRNEHEIKWNCFRLREEILFKHHQSDASCGLLLNTKCREGHKYFLHRSLHAQWVFPFKYISGAWLHHCATRFLSLFSEWHSVQCKRS